MAVRYFAQQPDPERFEDQVDSFGTYYKEIFVGADPDTQWDMFSLILGEIRTGTFPHSPSNSTK